MRLVLPGARRGRGLGGLSRRRRTALALLGLGWVVAGVLALVLLTGGDDERPTAPPTAQEPGFTPAPRPGETQVVETDGSLAVGITEQNPNFVWAPGAREIGEPFARWRAALDRVRPAYYRLTVDWASLQPDPAAPPNLDLPNGGCLRDLPPCGGWAGARDQLRAAASRQRETGMQVLVVLTGTPAWAARPASGCERAGTEPRSRPPRPDALPAYRALVAQLLAAGAQEGLELRYWSAWNEPNHPFFISPQRARCSGRAASVAVGPYVELARALTEALDAAPGDQQYVLGELSALTERKAHNTAVEEFARALPSDLVCGAKAWSQHGYVGGRDPVEPAAAGLAAHGCPRAPEIWITETGVGAPERGRERDGGAAAQRSACEAMDRRLRRWYEDPRVTAAFQYTLREDDRFPTGLVDTALARAYPVLRAWQAWGGERAPAAPAPEDACA
jgi:hypothetical protein